MGAVGGGGGRHQNTGTEEILQLQTDVFLSVPVLCQDIAYIIHEKKESLDKEKPCNVVLNIYIYLYIFFLYIYSCYNLNKCYVSPFFFLQLKNEFK